MEHPLGILEIFSARRKVENLTISHNCFAFFEKRYWKIKLKVGFAHMAILSHFLFHLQRQHDFFKGIDFVEDGGIGSAVKDGLEISIS